MDDVINPLNPQELQDLVSEPAQAPQPPQPVQFQPTGPMARPMARPVQRPVLRRPVEGGVAQPISVNTAPAQAAPIAAAPIAQPISPPVNPLAQPTTLARPAQPLTPAKALPKGIFILGALALTNLLLAFFSGNKNVFYTLAVALELAAAFALFSQAKRAFKTAYALQIFNALLVVVAVLNLAMAQAKIGQLTSQYTAAINQAGSNVTGQQELNIDNLNTQINSQKRAVGKMVGLDYARDLLGLGVCVGTFWYLRKPEVRAAFR